MANFNFVLKKYKIIKDFNGYRKGQIIAFSGADAEKYAENICSLKVAAPFQVKEQAKIQTKKVEEKPQEEVKEEAPKKVKRTYKRKTK